MSLSKKEIVLSFFPMAEVRIHAGGMSADSLVIGNPRVDGYYDCLSKCFLLGTDPDVLWTDAYVDLLARCRCIVETSENDKRNWAAELNRADVGGL